MKNKGKLKPIGFLAFFFVAWSIEGYGKNSPAASGSAAGMPRSPEECMKTAGTPNTNGYMPRGATDENLEEYKKEYRCEASRGRPIDQETCKETLSKLLKVATELNTLVKTNCKEIIPKLLSNQEAMACIASHEKGQGQSGCTQGVMEALKQVNPIIREFKSKLSTFVKVMNEAQENVFNVSSNVVNVIDQTDKAKGTPEFSQASPVARQVGLNTLEETYAFMGGQDPRVAESLLADFHDKFSNSQESYRDVNPVNYQQKFQPIEESWKKLDQVQSKILRENMHSYLNAEELKLATILYENQLQEVETQVQKQIATNEETVKGLGMAAPQMAAPLLTQVAGSGLTGVESGIGSSIPTLGKANLSSSGKTNSPVLASADGKVNIDSKKTGSLPGTETTSGASTLTGKSSAKEALRKKLLANAGSNQGTSASLVGSGSVGDGGSAVDREEANSKSFKSSDSSFSPAGGGSGERILSSFSGQNLLDTGFQMNGENTDNMVQAIVDGFTSALEEEQLEAAGIGAENDVSLFLRVRDFHDRCLKTGCVTGLAKK